MEKWGLRFGKFVPKVKPKDIVQSWRLRKGDLVEIITGKDKGRQGKITGIIRESSRVTVEGLNLARRHVATTPSLQGSIYNIEQAIHVSNVALVDPTTKNPTKTFWKFVETEDGAVKKVRMSKATNTEIPFPAPPPKSPRAVGQFDTISSEVLKITFKPSLTKSPIPKDCIL